MLLLVTVFAVLLGWLEWEREFVRDRQTWIREKDVTMLCSGTTGRTKAATPVFRGGEFHSAMSRYGQFSSLTGRTKISRLRRGSFPRPVYFSSLTPKTAR